MLFSKSSSRPRHLRRQAAATIVLAACALGSTSLGALTLGSESAGAASTTVILHFYQKQAALTLPTTPPVSRSRATRPSGWCTSEKTTRRLRRNLRPSRKQGVS